MLPSFPSTYLCFFMAKAENKLEKSIFSLADDEVIVGAALGEFFVKCLSVFMSVCVSFVMCQCTWVHVKFSKSAHICWPIHDPFKYMLLYLTEHDQQSVRTPGVEKNAFGRSSVRA